MRIILLLLLLFTLPSCYQSKEDINIIGKWYTFSQEFGYTEVVIDSNTIRLFSHYMGNNPGFYYRVEGDSIIYNGNMFSAHVSNLNDSIFVMNHKMTTDTFFKLENSVTTYNEIENGDSVIFNTYYSDFLSRKESAYKKYRSQ